MPPRTMPPAAAVDRSADDYGAGEVTAPVLTGVPLKMFLALAESSLFPVVRDRLLRGNGFPQLLLETFIPEEPLFLPDTAGWAAPGAGQGEPACGQDVDPLEVAASAAHRLLGPQGHKSSRPGSLASDLHVAFTGGCATPTAVAERVIAGIADSEAMEPPMRFLVSFDPERVRAQAAASTERYRAGRPLSVLDGVPFAVKDEVDVVGFETTSGTAFLAKSRPVSGTLPGVEALLAAGAVLLGKTTMHEIGLGVTGLNRNGTARNPHDPSRHTGGSSSGSAAVVAAGLCAFAVGGDGGGSIRIPAALCGCVGLKPTHNRVCPFPAPPMTHSVCVIGPIAGSVRDAALMYAMLSSRGHAALRLAPPPPLVLPDLSAAAVTGAAALAGKRAGIHWSWFEHGDAAVVAACRRAVGLLQERGLEVADITVPELREGSAAHSATIGSEMRACMSPYLQDRRALQSLNAETRISLATVDGFTSSAYITAQKIRRRMDVHFRRLFANLDFIITPAVPATAPAIRPEALKFGESDLSTTSKLMRFVQPANFVGFPAITVPVGGVPAAADGARGTGAADGRRLPVGLQLMAPPWHEAALLHAAGVLEGAVGAEGALRPAVHWDLLGPK